MKTIIAPVDFSDNAINALQFAIELAKRVPAKLTILTAVQNKQEEEKAEKKFAMLEAKLKKSTVSKLNYEIVTMQGSFLSVMKKAIAAMNPDLIVMGTKGASGLKRILIGSNTVNVISKTKQPVLVIPESARFGNFLRKGKSKIVLATNLELLHDEHALDPLKKIALMVVEPKVRVVSVRPKNTSLSPIGRMERDRLLSFFTPELESEPFILIRTQTRALSP
jgi:nucleotide-binding universal stress UspA family protein